MRPGAVINSYQRGNWKPHKLSKMHFFCALCYPPMGVRGFDIWLHYSLILLKYLYLFKICMQFVNLTAAAFAVSHLFMPRAFFNCHLCRFIHIFFCFCILVYFFFFYLLFILIFLWQPLRLIAFRIWINEFFISAHTCTASIGDSNMQTSFISFHFISYMYYYFFFFMATDNRIKQKTTRANRSDFCSVFFIGFTFFYNAAYI